MLSVLYIPWNILRRQVWGAVVSVTWWGFATKQDFIHSRCRLNVPGKKIGPGRYAAKVAPHRPIFFRALNTLQKGMTWCVPSFLALQLQPWASTMAPPPPRWSGNCVNQILAQKAPDKSDYRKWWNIQHVPHVARSAHAAAEGAHRSDRVNLAQGQWDMSSQFQSSSSSGASARCTSKKRIWCKKLLSIGSMQKKKNDAVLATGIFGL